MTFQHDNTRPHVARVCQDFLANNNIVQLDWPPYSPDLSPIEHLWDELDRRVRRRRNTTNTLGQLRTALLEEWENIPMRKINALVNSMQRRIGDKCQRGTHQILTRCDFDFTIWGVPSKRLLLLINCRSKSNEILRIYQRIIIFSTHMNIFTIMHNTSM